MIYKDKSYGLISVSRVRSSGTKLFGSNIEHNSFIKLKISNASLERKLNTDRYYDEENITSIYLSTNQWADMLTNMNSNGVPCTIRFTREHGTIEFKEMESTIDYSYNDAQAKIENSQYIQLMDDITNDIENSKLGKKSKEEILRKLHNIKTIQQRNAKYYLKSFTENASKVIIEARATIEQARQAVVEKLGLEKLNELQQENLNKNNNLLK